MKPKAVVLLSGGIDSSTTLYYALNKGYLCRVLVFNYSQRHVREINSAKKIASLAGVDYLVLKLNFPWRGSALLDKNAKIPLGKEDRKEIPSTYVPARNIIFLSYALSYAESISASEIFIGANAVDYSGYPDCRPQFIRAFQKMALVGTKAGVEGKGIKISAPLIKMKKSEIIKLGAKLGVPYEYTWSCYRGGKISCGRCDSCILRKKGFKEAGLEDPLWKK
ncbi:MAG: 7-cyano-7-deazaguanine synthase QueC [Candidatus Omnitrophica bacterium 4484_49]|nr:7-cyano-7-deazaguanine synthase QueC [Candidatus Omnitrophota bacterium]OQX83597.1 MAG: 7-cyano-7-deazaguanine synthase QueC [Candidatus Omnitrophica bacterium 4484_49]